MKFSTQEEYGLRCLLQIARSTNKNGMTIPQISQAEGLSEANVAKMLRILRMGGIIESARGHEGGYRLARTADQIRIGDVLTVLGGRLFD
ncbi:MAG TPA: Rrf2 family transcriptional regulator, partial [bacterium]|nr:Rrf2 family transcriptional regulator [bacterium]